MMMYTEDLANKLTRLLSDYAAFVKTPSEEELRSGGFDYGLIVSSPVPGPASFEILISSAEALVIVEETTLGTEFSLADETDVEDVVDFVKHILQGDCITTTWTRSGKVVASTVQVKGTRHRRMSISGILKLGSKKKVIQHMSYKATRGSRPQPTE